MVEPTARGAAAYRPDIAARAVTQQRLNNASNAATTALNVSPPAFLLWRVCRPPVAVAQAPFYCGMEPVERQLLSEEQVFLCHMQSASTFRTVPCIFCVLKFALVTGDFLGILMYV